MGLAYIPTPYRPADFTEDPGGVRDLASITRLKFQVSSSCDWGYFTPVNYDTLKNTYKENLGVILYTWSLSSFTYGQDFSTRRSKTDKNWDWIDSNMILFLSKLFLKKAIEPKKHVQFMLKSEISSYM